MMDVSVAYFYFSVKNGSGKGKNIQWMYFIHEISMFYINEK